jgi:hypothetical protein
MSFDETINGQIISAVVKWGAITHRDLYCYLNLNSKFSTLNVRTHTLIKKKVLKSSKLASQKKTILYACEGTRLLAGDDFKLTPNNQLSHDSGLSNICIRLLQLKNVYDISTVKQEDETTKFSLIPDAEAYIMDGDGSIQIAIEYEATQKSKSRIVNKYFSYSQSKDYEYVFYFFDSERESLVYAKTLYELTQNKLNQHASLKPERFYFFVRNRNAGMSDFLKSFRPMYPDNVENIINILSGTKKIN